MKPTKYFLDSILPCVICSLLVGVSPMFIQGDGRHRRPFTSKYLHCVNVGFMALFGILILRTISESKSSVMSNNYYQSNRISNIGIAFVFAGGIVYVYVIYICGFCKIESIKDTLIRFARMDEKLKKLGQDMMYFKSLVYQLSTQFAALLLICVITAMQQENIHKEHFKELSTVTWIVFIFPAVIVNVFENQFSYTVLLINQRFKMINQQLRSLSDANDDRCSNDNISIFQQGFGNKLTVLKKIEILMKMHDDLCDMSEIVNQNYTMPVVVNLMFQYGILLFSLFYSYWMFNIKPFSAICWIMWSVLKVSEVLHVTISCHFASKQAKQTGTEVHKLLLQPWHTEITNKLMIFSKQLMHRKVSFTVWGILTLDATLLFTMVGAAATYMVIMLQFQQASLPMTCKANAVINPVTNVPRADVDEDLDEDDD